MQLSSQKRNLNCTLQFNFIREESFIRQLSFKPQDRKQVRKSKFRMAKVIIEKTRLNHQQLIKNA